MNYSRTSTQSIALLLVVSFLVPSALISVPKKAQAAATNCVAPIAGALAAGYALIGTKEVTGVGVAPGDSTANAVGAGSQFGNFFNTCILKPLAITMAKTMVRRISNSLVNWINSGFQGKPGFITDFKGLVRDSADSTIGNFIYGSDLKFLCQPFSVRIRLRLATKYQKTFQEEVRCRLSDVTGNVQNFANNNGGAGWNNWLQLTTEPQNNEYGAYLMAEGQLAGQIQEQLDTVNKQLDRGGGFLDHKVCDEKATDRESSTEMANRVANAQKDLADYQAGESSYIPSTEELEPKIRCKTGGRSVTPGSLVSQQASKVIGNWADELNLATEIDQVVGALLSHFADKMITGATGFLGLSSPGGHATQNMNFSQAIAANQSTTDPLLNQIDAQANGTLEEFNDSITELTSSGGSGAVQTPQSSDSNSQGGPVLQDGERTGVSGYYTFTQHTDPIIIDLGSEKYVRSIEVFTPRAQDFTSTGFELRSNPSFMISVYDPGARNIRVATTDSDARDMAQAEGTLNGDFVPATITQIGTDTVWFSTRVQLGATAQYIRVLPNPSLFGSAGSNRAYAVAVSEIAITEGQAGDDTSTNPSDTPAIIDIQKMREMPSPVNSSTPFNLERKLVSTRPESNLTLTVTLRERNGASIPFANFRNARFTYGPSDGSQSSFYLSSNSGSAFNFSNISLNSNRQYIFKFIGDGVTTSGSRTVDMVLRLNKGTTVVAEEIVQFTITR